MTTWSNLPRPVWERDQLPSTKPEIRQAASYTDALTAALLAQAGGETGLVRSQIAAVGTAAGWWARAFASATLTPGPVADAYGPALRGYTGRQLVLKGEAVFILDGDGGLSLTPVSSWEVMGGSDPETWVYRCTTPGPNESTVVDVRQSRILHLMYQRSDKPWQGVGPLSDCQESHNLAQALETRLRQEVSGPVGAMVPMPDGGGPVDGLEKDVNAMRGGIRLPPSTANNWNQGAVQGGAPRTDWRSLRIGADPSDTLRGLRSDTARDILAACGVPGGLSGQVDAQTLREQLREFLYVGVTPVAGELADTIRQTFGLAEFAFDFSPLMASDLSGRARAFGQLVAGGKSTDEAAKLTNLLEVD